MNTNKNLAWKYKYGSTWEKIVTLPTTFINKEEQYTHNHSNRCLNSIWQYSTIVHLKSKNNNKMSEN